MSLLVYAFDPHPNGAYAVKAVIATNRVESAEFFTAPSVASFTRTPYALHSRYLTLIAIEENSLYSRRDADTAKLKAISKNLIASEYWAGFIHGQVFANPDYKIIRLPANAPGKQESWRYLLTGNPRANTAEIKHVVTCWLGGKQKLKELELDKSKNEHYRDALGLAIAAAQKYIIESRSA